jgi:hypothetical protein
MWTTRVYSQNSSHVFHTLQSQVVESGLAIENDANLEQ